MKKKFVIPSISVNIFRTENIITTSGETAQSIMTRNVDDAIKSRTQSGDQSLGTVVLNW